MNIDYKKLLSRRLKKDNKMQDSNNLHWDMGR